MGKLLSEQRVCVVQQAGRPEKPYNLGVLHKAILAGFLMMEKRTLLGHGFAGWLTGVKILELHAQGLVYLLLILRRVATTILGFSYYIVYPWKGPTVANFMFDATER